MSVLEFFFCARTVQSIFAWNFNSLVVSQSGSHDTWHLIQQPSCILHASQMKCLYYYMTIWSDVLCQDLWKLGSATFYHYRSTMLSDI